MPRIGRGLLLISLVLAACSSGGPDSSEEAEGEADYYADQEDDVAPSEDESRGGETYSEFDARRDDYDGDRGSFGGYGCTQDCSGHEAGYSWAEAKGITDPDQCGGKSWSFIEGCRAYAEENQGEGEY